MSNYKQLINNTIQTTKRFISINQSKPLIFKHLHPPTKTKTYYNAYYQPLNTVFLFSDVKKAQ